MQKHTHTHYKVKRQEINSKGVGMICGYTAFIVTYVLCGFILYSIHLFRLFLLWSLTLLARIKSFTLLFHVSSIV